MSALTDLGFDDSSQRGVPKGRRRRNGFGWPDGHQQATQGRELTMYLFWSRHHMVYELPLSQSRPPCSPKCLVASPPLRPWVEFVYPLWLQIECDDKFLPGSEHRPSWFLWGCLISHYEGSLCLCQHLFSRNSAEIYQSNLNQGKVHCNVCNDNRSAA